MTVNSRWKAEDSATQIQALIGTGVDPFSIVNRTGDESLVSIAAKILKLKSVRVSPDTVDLYRQTFDAYRRTCGNLALRDLTRPLSKDSYEGGRICRQRR